MIYQNKNIKFKKLNNFMKPKSVQLFQTNNKTSSSWLILGILSSALLSSNVFRDYVITCNT